MRDYTDMYVEDFVFEPPESEVTHYELLQEMWAPVYGEQILEQLRQARLEVLAKAASASETDAITAWLRQASWLQR